MAMEARAITAGGSGERRLTTEYVAARALLDASSIEEAASRHSASHLRVARLGAWRAVDGRPRGRLPSLCPDLERIRITIS